MAPTPRDARGRSARRQRAWSSADDVILPDALCAWVVPSPSAQVGVSILSPSASESVPASRRPGPASNDVENTLLPRTLLPSGSMAARLRNGVEPTASQAPHTNVTLTGNGGGQKNVGIESPVPRSSGSAVAGKRKSPLGLSGTSLLELVEHKVLCSSCESVAHDVVREAEHKTRGLVERARSLKRPTLPAPATPCAAEGESTLHSAIDNNKLAAVNRTLLPAVKKNDSTSPAIQTSSLSPMDGQASFSFPFSGQLDAKPVEMKDITGKRIKRIRIYSASTGRHRDLPGWKLCFDSTVCLCRRRDAPGSASDRSGAREARNNYPISATPSKNGCRPCKMRPLHTPPFLRPNFPNRDAQA